MKSARPQALAALFGLVFMVVLVIPTTAQEWVKLTPTGTAPPPLYTHKAVYDPNRNQMIIYGRPTGAFTNENWRLTNANGLGATAAWVQDFPAGASVPSPRAAHGMDYDAANDRLVVFAGALGSASPCTNDVWVLVNASGAGGTPTWQRLAPLGGPPPVRGGGGATGHTAVYDPVTNSLIIFGGNNCFNTNYRDAWILSHANGLGGTPTWTRLPDHPLIRRNHTAVYDQNSNRMIVFGGDDAVSRFKDVWVLKNANNTGGAPTWEQLFPSGGPSLGRNGHTAVYDTTSNRMIVFGGADGVNPPLSDVWVLSDANGIGTPAWTKLSPSGIAPGLFVASAVYDSANKRMTVFGGFDGSAWVNDVWVLAENQAPVADAGPDQVLIVGESGEFNGAGSFDPDGTITSFDWDFGDSGTANGAIVNHVYQATGNFTVTLTVTDDDGATDTDTAAVTVQTTAEAIQDLSGVVQSFNLQQGISNSLDAKLDNVMDALDAANAGQRQDAANKLMAFINSVEAQRGEKLTDAQADTLVAAARRVLGVI